MFPATLVWLLLVGIGDAVGWRWFARQRRPSRALAALAATSAWAGVCTLACCESPFGFIRLAAWSTFGHLPVALAGVAIGLRHPARRWSATAGIAAVALWVIAVDAFLIEPTALEVSRVTVPTSKLTAPLRIVVLSDLQTDHIGEYERSVLRRAAAEQPDLVLWPGDYLQVFTEDEYAEAAAELRAAIAESGLAPPLGQFAVGGDVEHGVWAPLFAGTAVTAVDRRTTLTVGPLALTALSLLDSRNLDLRVAPADRFHVVFGHAPDFALGDVAADLLVAGHTHGGQVQLPGIGPLLTLARVPRDWASGVTTLPSGATLVVSRGIGMERRHAPRLRFLCRPEIVVIDCVPTPR